MKKTIVAALIVILTVCLCQSLDARKKKTDHLTAKYKKFLQDVHYIITKRERDVFLKLKTDRERDVLIHAFWRHRDPTKGTPENEFKEEHYRRLRHVEQFYGRSKTRAGWETDRGKVYIILGKPLSIQRFEGFSTVLPTEVWHYQQAPRAGLPPAFNIVFFDRNKIGEYVLYSPLADGPQKLLVGFQGRPGDYLEAYEKLKDYNSFLARVALSLVPGEEISPGQPSMSSDFLLRNVEEAPKKLVSDLYARKFLQYKGVVEVEYSVNYINSKSLSQLIIDSEGNNNLSYIVELERLSMDRYDNRFFTNIAVYGTLTHRSGKNGDNAANVYQFEKNFSVRKDEREFRELQKSSFAITDHFPIIPGEFHLSLVVKNTNSKEFTVHEADISVPHGPNGKLLLMAPLLAYDVNFGNTSGPAVPFGTGIGRFLVDPTNKFKRSDNLIVFCQLFDASKELKKSGNIKLA
ncbi:MAG: GWxTD domain-containing protein [bacterium]|nr:GWxTD domain-containing protein [bacterium]